MNNAINVRFDDKKRRLKVTTPFYLNDVVREFPSRRFMPKGKYWEVAITKINMDHLESVKHKYNFVFDEEAKAAIGAFQVNSGGPKYQPFPWHVYDCTKSQAGYAPMPHQKAMMDFGWNLPAIAYFAEMGTGKTFVTIHMACARWKGGLIDRLAVICPSTLKATWEKEFKKYATVPYDIRHHETKASWLKDFYAERPKDRLQVLTISAEGLGVSEALYDSACGFFVGGRVMAVADESSRFKNPSALRTQRAIALVQSAEFRSILNGTPIALGIHDLWAQYEFLDPNIIGSGDYWAFKTRYLQMGGYESKQIVGYQNMAELMEAIKPWTIEVRKRDVLKFLPPKVYHVPEIEATPEQRRLFKTIIKEGGVGDGVLIKVENTLERLLRLRQVIGGYLPRAHPRTVRIKDPDTGEMIDAVQLETVVEPLAKNPKMDWLMDFIEENRSGSKFIIWCSFRHEIQDIVARLRSKYGDSAVESYYGDTDKAHRPIVEDRYCRDPAMRFVVGNPTSAGLGLTFISGENDVMVYYSGTNAFIDRAQSEDRAHRIGQENSVNVFDPVMQGTVDVVIQESIAAKKDLDIFIKDAMAEGRDLIKLIHGL